MNIIPRPQVQVVQSFVPSPVSNLAAQHAYVFGPQYQLMYFDDPDVKHLTQAGAYDPATGNVFTYPQLDSRGTVALDSVRVFMESVLARYVTLPDEVESPLFVVSARDKHKVRAAPYVEEALEAKSGPTAQEVSANGVFLQAGGCVNNSPDLPTNYYLWPSQLAILNQFNNEPAQDAVLIYETSSGVRGDVSILATDNPLGAGSTVSGPHGLVLDLDAIDQDNNAYSRVAARLTYQASTDFTGGSIVVNGAAPVAYDVGATNQETVDTLVADIKAVPAFAGLDLIHVHGPNADEGALWLVGANNVLLTVTQSGAAVAPSLTQVLAFNALVPARQLVFRNAAGTASFTLAIKESALPTLMDLSVANGQVPLAATVTDAAALDVSWDATAAELDIEFDAGTTTLDAVRTALLGVPNSDLTFDVSEITGSGTAPLDVVYDQWGTPLWHGAAVAIVRDVYRIRVEDSPYVFRTGNGFQVSSHFKSRGVRVGDVVAYNYLNEAGDSVQGKSTVAGFQADRVAARYEQPTVNLSNQPDLPPGTITPNQGLDIVVPGSDNQRRFDGQYTKVYALGSQTDDFEYAGNLPSGALEETFTLRITTGGVPGVARGVVSGSSGYYREDARILNSPDGDAAKAVVYLGRNLWVTFNIGTTDGDFRFQPGDWFTITPPVNRRWTQVDAGYVAATGNYAGPANTTYVLEVVRGGHFSRQHTARAGVQTPDQAVISYTANPASPADSVAVGTSVIDAVDFLDATPAATYANLRNWINLLAENVTAQLVPDSVDPVNAGQLIIRGPADLIQAVDLVSTGTYTGATIGYAAVELDADISNWSAGDTDDEYILRCTAGGTLANSRFSFRALGGDQQTNVRFDDGVARFVGDNGVQLTLTLVGSPVFRIGDEWVVNVRATRPQVAIRDTAGIDAASLVTLDGTQPFSVGVYGLAAQFTANPNGGLAKGDQFYIEAIAERDGAYRTLVLEDPVAPGFAACPAIHPTRLALDLHMRINTLEVDAPRHWSPPNFDWTASADSVTISPNLRIQSDDWVNPNGTQDWIPVVAGNASIQYRALLDHYTDGLYSLYNTDDVITTLGRIHPDNPLAQGMYHALLNSAGRQVFYTGVRTDDLEGYARVLALAEHNSQVYGLVPMTRDPMVLDAVQGHLNQMSDESVKQWRIGFFGSNVEQVAALYASNTHGMTDGQDWTATVQDDPAAPGTQFTELTAEGATFLQDLRVGDVVRLRFSTDPWGAVTYVTDTVAEIRSNTILILATGLPNSVDVPEKFEIWRSRTKADLVAAYEAHCASFASRRVYCAVPRRLWQGNTEYGAEVAAAAIAGLVSAVAPQQPVTNVELIGFESIPEVFQTFTQNDLDRIASAGGMITMQESRGGRVYIRHQVSTATREGDLYKRELSITKNLDACSYLLANQLEPYYGRYNITQALLAVIKTQVDKMLDWMTSEASGAGLLGPMLLDELTRFVSIQQHPTLKDHILIEVDLELPVPANVIRLTAVVGDLASFRAVDTGTDEIIAGILN